MRSRAEDLTGKQFTRLRVLTRAGKKGAHAAWLCRCTCGREVVVAAGHLKDGSTKACGCLLRAGLHQRRHGQYDSVEYTAWAQLIQRCTNKRHKSYPHYGGRGITVCARWLESFENFLEDMGRRPGLGYSIDRKNNDGNYEKENCRWATAKEQRNNSRQNVFLTYDGQTLTLKQWAEMLGINYSTLTSRYRKGRPVAEVLGKAKRDGPGR